MELIGTKPNKKVVLRDPQDDILGEAYVNSYQQDKEQMGKKSNSLPTNLKKRSPRKMSPQKMM